MMFGSPCPSQTYSIDFDLEELDKHLVTVVENMLKGRSCLPNQRRRAAVAQLFLRTGELRAQVSAYRSAHFFFSSAIVWSDEFAASFSINDRKSKTRKSEGFGNLAVSS